LGFAADKPANPQLKDLIMDLRIQSQILDRVVKPGKTDPNLLNRCTTFVMIEKVLMELLLLGRSNQCWLVQAEK
jgi:hypothetical protein